VEIHDIKNISKDQKNYEKFNKNNKMRISVPNNQIC